MNQETKQKILQELEDKINQKSGTISALQYALGLAKKDHDNAADMVANVPQNIYIEDWKRKEQSTAKKCALLEALDEQLFNELDALCNEREQVRQQSTTETHYEVLVQVLNEGQGEWIILDTTQVEKFDNLTDAQNRAESLKQETEKTAPSGQYRTIVESVEDGIVTTLEERKFEIVGEYFKTCPVNRLKSGEIFRLIRNGKPTAKVYVLLEYDHTEKKYTYYNYADVCDWHYIKGSTLVAVGFTF